MGNFCWGVRRELARYALYSSVWACGRDACEHGEQQAMSKREGGRGRTPTILVLCPPGVGELVGLVAQEQSCGGGGGGDRRDG
jgi:hypothetical protein